MARTQSKILSKAEQKIVDTANKQAIKDAKQALKDAVAAQKAHAKEVGSKTKELDKAVAVAQKAYDKLAPAAAAEE